MFYSALPRCKLVTLSNSSSNISCKLSSARSSWLWHAMFHYTAFRGTTNHTADSMGFLWNAFSTCTVAYGSRLAFGLLYGKGRVWPIVWSIFTCKACACTYYLVESTCSLLSVLSLGTTFIRSWQWYSAAPVGQHTLGKTVSRMCSSAGFRGKYNICFANRVNYNVCTILSQWCLVYWLYRICFTSFA